MSPLRIVKNPDDRLRMTTVDLPLERIRDREFQKLIDRMIETMYAANGIGLAANQVGEPWNLAIVLTGDGPLPLINPRILRSSFRKEWAEEGCLSVPGAWGEVKRSLSVRAVARDRNGGTLDLNAKGLFARVIQHECDHLAGTLIIDKARSIHEEKR